MTFARGFSKSLNPDRADYSINPSFSVHKNGTSQPNVTGIEKVTWSTESFDTNNNFASNAFTPTVAGKYMLHAHLHWTAVQALDSLSIIIRKNDVQVNIDTGDADDIFHNHDITAIVDANGSTDYFEIFTVNATRNTSSVVGAIDETYFMGCKID